MENLRKMFDRWRRRTPEERLAAIEAELAEGWSYPAYDRLREMADHGNAGAQYRLGQLYEQAEGVIQNLADAVHWYTVAAEQGHVPSQTRLGLIYFIDPPSAATLTAEEYESVAKGQLPSGTMLEKLFPHGFSVTKDFALAAKWNRLAAVSGVAEAQARYGHQLASGLGVERDVAEGEHWFLAAAAQGDSAVGRPNHSGANRRVVRRDSFPRARPTAPARESLQGRTTRSSRTRPQVRAGQIAIARRRS